MQVRARVEKYKGRWAGVMLGLCLGFVGDSASGEGTPPREEAPLFAVSKSENRNQVAYVVRLDAACRPVGNAPVFAYWRMLERAPSATEPLLAIEQGVYGVGPQVVVERGESGGAIRFSLRALPGREILVQTSRRGPGCAAGATTRIGDRPARLFGIHARIQWPFGVASVEISGWSEADGRMVRETLRP